MELGYAGTSDLDADKVIKLDTSVDMELQHCINTAYCTASQDHHHDPL